MDLNIKIKYFIEDGPRRNSWLCFRHAVAEAQRGENVKTEIGDYDSDYYMGSTWCETCADERNREIFKNETRSL